MMKKSDFFNDKKAQGLSVNTIILIILGVIVLVALIFGFTLGYQGLKDRLAPSNNIGTIVSACQTACATNVQYDFCTSQRDLKADNGVQVNDATCFYLSQNRTEFGIEKCGTITCSNSVLLDQTSGKNVFDTQVLFDTSVGVDKKSGLCAIIENKGKMLYALSTDGKTLLSVTCAASTQ